MPLDVQAFVTVGVLIGVIVALAKDLARPDLVFLSALAALLVAGVLTPEDAFAGFANSAIWVIGSLFVVAEAVQRTDLLSALDRVIFSNSRSVTKAVFRLAVVSAPASAFLNNTPIVAILVPRVQSWCRQMGVPPSKMLIPLSYATIVGGTVTLVGTSTNVVVSGLLVSEGLPPLGMFTLTAVGLPVAVFAILYLGFVGHRLLPSRGIEQMNDPETMRTYVFELRVQRDAALVGKTIDEAGLRSLGNAFLVHLRRDHRVIEVTPAVVLEADDILAFTGDATSLDPLLQRRGLESIIANGENGGLQTFPLYEAVVADTSPLVGRSLRDSQFREHYGGVVLAIHRKSERISGPIGRTPLREGDLLLIEARNGFAARWNARRDEFYLVAPRSKYRNVPQLEKAPWALGILILMVTTVATGLLPLTIATFTAALAMIATKCISTDHARRAVNVQVLIVIASAFGLGHALSSTGVAGATATLVLGHASAFGPIGIIAAIYLMTNVLTELVTNGAAAAIMFSVGLAASVETALPIEAIAVTVAIGASASFMTPIGYQTNMMVMSAGHYKFSDYVKTGLPVSIIVMFVAVSAIYLVWLH
ncbi:MAG: SLC13 family permease [Rhodothermales bacterium]